MSDYNRNTENIKGQSFVKAFGLDIDIPKSERYGWKPILKKGEFAEISKDNLKIDLTYQRQGNVSRILKIAREFDWALFGALIVIQGMDKSFYVLDGGHRFRAAMLRHDVDKVPCMVHAVSSPEEEARIFLNYQDYHKPLRPYERHRALIACNDDVAIEADLIVNEVGYQFADNTALRYGTNAIATTYRIIKRNKSATKQTFKILATIAEGAPIKKVELEGLFYLIIVNPQTDFFGFPLKNMLAHGFGNIQSEIKRYRDARGKGGEKVYAEALLDIINKGKSKNKVIVLT